MLKYALVSLIISALLYTGPVTAEYPRDMQGISKYQSEMRDTPDMVSPDAIYIGYSMDKVYYQSIETARLLERTNELLEELREMLQEIRKDLDGLTGPGSSETGADKEIIR